MNENQIPIAMPLAQRLLLAAELALVPHTPGDDHTGPAARKVVLAVLDQLTRTASVDVALQIREVMNKIAADLVSGEDRSEPTPAPRLWRAGDRAVHAGTPGRITFVGGATVPWEFDPDEGEAFRFYNPAALSEVVTPEGTS